ncbi:MAG TPA: vitamin B12 dependent-methionine synthase activation domain-containing protein [bacterium]|nr:vitamin B12 dependent-methionine synthase activation domain-containing protein [bacterium]
MVIVNQADPRPLISELPRKLAARLGYNQRNPPDNIIGNAITESISMVGERFKPRGLYKTMEVKSVDGNGIRVEQGTIKSPLLARLAGRCGGEKSIAFSIATAGEEWREGFSPGASSWMDLLIDALGSELAELAADLVQDRYQADAQSRGLQVSARMSPGYCDWGLEGQELIFKALDARKIGVSLTPHFIMIPAKTVSGAAVLAQNIAFKSPCALCSKDCPHRRI